jgi:DNA-binding response OmpR family regulator
MAMDATGTVLMIENDAMIQELVHEILVDEGYRVLRATDGEDGLRIAAAARPGVILLDFGLPHASGADVLTRLKHDPATSHIPVIAVTGMPAALGGSALPIDGWIAKPFDLDVLLAQVERFVDVPASAASRMAMADPAPSRIPVGTG